MKRLIIGIVLALSVLWPSTAHAQGSLLPWVAEWFPAVNGVSPAALGFVCTYAAGTTTPQPTYQDVLLMTPNQNPVRLNTAGRPVNGSTQVSIFLSGVSYKVNWYAAGTGNTCNGTTVGALIKSVDGVFNPASLRIFDNISLCDRYTGDTAGEKIAACLAELPNGMTAYIGFAGAQTLGTLTIPNNYANILFNPAGAYTGKIVITGGHNKISGAASIACTSGACLTVGLSTFTSSPLTMVTDGNEIHDLRIDSTGDANIILYRAPKTTIQGTQLTGASSYCIRGIASDSWVHVWANDMGPGSNRCITGVSIEDGSNQWLVQYNNIIADQTGIQWFNSIAPILSNNQYVGAVADSAQPARSFWLRTDQAFPTWGLTWVPGNAVTTSIIENNLIEGTNSAGHSYIDIQIGDSTLGASVQRPVGNIIRGNTSLVTAPTGGTHYAIKVDRAQQTEIDLAYNQGIYNDLITLTANAVNTHVRIPPLSTYNSTISGSILVDSGSGTVTENLNPINAYYWIKGTSTATVVVDKGANTGGNSLNFRTGGVDKAIIGTGVYQMNDTVLGLGDGTTQRWGMTLSNGNVAMTGVLSGATQLLMPSAATVNFGGTTSGVPMLKGVGAELQDRLADDSDYGVFSAKSYVANGSAGAVSNLSCGSGEAVKAINVQGGIVVSVSCGVP